MDEHDESRGLTRGGLIKAGALAALAVGAGGAGAALAGAAGVGAAASVGIGKPRRGPAYLTPRDVRAARRHRVPRPPPRRRARSRVRLIEARRAARRRRVVLAALPRARRAGVEGGIYRLEHPVLGSFELFVSPVGRGVKGLDLEAVINRIAT